MRGTTPLFLAIALSAGTAPAGWPLAFPMSVERLPNGNTVIADGGGLNSYRCRAVEVDSLGRLEWAYLGSDVSWSHSARRGSDGNTVITGTEVNRVIEVDPGGRVVWEHSAGLNYPNEAWPLPGGNVLITDRLNNRVIEVDRDGNIAWSCTTLFRPHGGRRLSNGNLLVCDAAVDGVLEFDPAGNVVWQCTTGLNWPRSAERLANGNTLIADSRNNRVVEVTPSGEVVWSIGAEALTYSATRLANGNTLFSVNTENVREVRPDGSVVWRYPRTVEVTVEELRVYNPASGCSLYVHIHRPAWASADHPVPGVVLVPDGAEPGTVFDSLEIADRIADDGFAVLHFDAEGRGRTPGTREDWCGTSSQDGMHQCLVTLAARPWVDTDRLGVFSFGYGITMATGTIARHPEPRVKFLLDFEGPADRYDASSDSGGVVPFPPDSNDFWQEREAAGYIRSIDVAYLRMQTQFDTSGSRPKNEHAIALVDSATSTAHGGSGNCRWTRVNDSVMNPANRVYTVSDPPEWIPELQQTQNGLRWLLYLHELAGGDPAPVRAGPTVGVTGRRLLPSANPVRAGTGLAVTGPVRGPLLVVDASGRQVARLPGRSSGAFSEYRWPADVAPGCYWLLADNPAVAPLKLVVSGR